MKAAIMLFAVLLSGCTTMQPVEDGPSAGLGQVAVTNGLSVRPTSIVEDSRCPANVQCVWAGRLIVRTQIKVGGSWKETRDLELGKAQQVADGGLTLIAAEPPKQAGAEIDPRAYRFTFDFQGGL